VTASTPAEAAAAVRAAGARGLSCWRGGCGHEHLDLRLMNRLRFYQPGDLTVGADAGMTVAALDAILAGHRQFVPLDVADPERTTLGAVLARHLSGPLRQRFGTVRDFVLGLEIINDQGETVRCGGSVVKNVAGYDWMKLMIGARGALGILTGVNFKVFPLPRELESACFSGLSWPRVEALRAALLHSQLRPLAIELHAHSGERSVTVTFAGSAAVRGRYRAELGKLGSPRFEENLWPAATPPASAVFPPAQAVAALQAWEQKHPQMSAMGRLGVGAFYLEPPLPPPPPAPAAAAWMRRLKQQLDPRGLFHGENCGLTA
jgi:FAD/FMN-containing dehydrogenase